MGPADSGIRPFLVGGTSSGKPRVQFWGSVAGSATVLGDLMTPRASPAEPPSATRTKPAPRPGQGQDCFADSAAAGGYAGGAGSRDHTFLCSGDASFLTGETLSVSAGL